MRSGQSLFAGSFRQLRWLLLAGVAAMSTSATFAGQVTYSYDEAGRLKGATYGNGTQTTYVLDAAGNRVSVAISVAVTAPSVPTGLKATAPTSSQVNLSWTASTDSVATLAGYQVFRNGTLLSSVTAPTTTYSDTSTTCNSTYSYVVKAYDTATPPNVSGPSDALSVTTPITNPPSAPTGLAATSVTTNQVVLTWTASADPCSTVAYWIYRGGQQIGSTTTTTYTDATVNSATVYSYTIVAHDSVTPTPNQATSTALSVTTPPNPPVTPIATAIEPNYVTVTWGGVTGAALSGYKLYRNGSLLTTVAAGVTSYNDTTVVGSTAYTYSVSAYESGAESAHVSANAVTTPTLFQITGVGGGVLPQVSAYYTSSGPNPGASPGNSPWTYSLTQAYGGHAVVRSSVSSSNVQACPYIDSLAPGYSVGTGSNCLITYATPAVFGTSSPPTVPTNLSATASSATQVTLSWTGSTDVGGAGLAGYQIFRNGAYLGSSSSTSYSDASVACNVAYSYTVAAYDSANPPTVSGQSGSASVTTPIGLPPSVPTGLNTSSVTASQVVVTWSASSDPCGVSVAGYRIFRNGAQIGTSTTTSYTDTGVVGATFYSYTIVAYDSSAAANASAQSSALGVTTPAQPYQITDANGNVIPAASSLYRSAIVPANCGPGGTNGPCNFVVNQLYGAQLNVRTDTNGNPSYIAPGYSIGSGANLKVTYASAGTYGGYLPPSTPTSLTGSAVSSSQVNLSWGASTDTSGVLAGYQVFRNGSQIGTAGAASFADTSTVCNTSYSYTVRAYDTFSPPDVSGTSNTFSVTTPITVAPSVPGTPSASSVTASQVVLTWGASSDSCSAIAGYRIYRNGTQIGTSAGASYTDTTVAGGVTYSYTVAAYDSATPVNVSGQSGAVSVTTPAAIYQITDSTGHSLSSLYTTRIAPAVCGSGTGNGPCNYIVTEIAGTKNVRIDTGPTPTGPWVNQTLLPGYTIGSPAMVTFATAAVYGQ